MASEFVAPIGGARNLTSSGDLYLGDPVRNQWKLAKAQSPGLAPTLNGSIAERLSYPMFGYNPTVYENVFEAVDLGIVRRYGTNFAAAWTDQTTYRTTKWNNANMLQLGYQANPTISSTAVTIPSGSSMLWIRVLNEGVRQIRLNVGFDEENTLGGPPANYVCRHSWVRQDEWKARFSPYGESYNNVNPLFHYWIPFNLNSDKGGTAYIYCKPHAFDTPDAWISGIAFTENPWNMSFYTIMDWHRSEAGAWTADWFGAWNGFLWVKRDGSPTAAPINLVHPVVNNGKDKVFNMICKGDQWFRNLPPIAVNGTILNNRTTMIETLEPFKWSYIKNAPLTKVVSYVIPASVINIGSGTPHHMNVEVRVNQMRTGIFYACGSYCCDLNA
jgi:hypothetical protein